MKKNMIKAWTLAGLILVMATLTWLMFAEAPYRAIAPWMVLMKIAVVAIFAWIACKFLDLVERVLKWPKKTKPGPKEFNMFNGDLNAVEKPEWESDPRD